MAEISVIRCPCGFEARSESVEEVIQAAKRHVVEVHSQSLTDEQARALIERVSPPT